MKYSDTLQLVDTAKALKKLQLEFREQGAYSYFPCPKCQKDAAIKVYGEKKNLWYCKHCTASGHIISLTRDIKGIEWQEAKESLSDCMATSRKTLLPLSFNYELVFNDTLEQKGLTKELCEKMEVGKPKGKTMLAGCIAFAVYDQGKKVAYYGIRIKDGKPVFHKSFNPELYLYNGDYIEEGSTIILTTDIFQCLKIMQTDCYYPDDTGTKAVCNFGLPYLSTMQMEMLSKADCIVVSKETPFEIIRTLINNFDEVHIQKM